MAVVVAALAAAVVLPLSQASQASGPTTVNGKFDFAGKLITGCPLGVVLCTSGKFTGTVNGPFEFRITSMLPSTTLGVFYFDGRLTLHTGSGDIRCNLNGALNTNTGSDGEFGEICVITGGTGAYTNARGHFRLMGTSSGGLTSPAGGGEYAGIIK